MKHEELTEKIIGCFYTVYNKSGYGFLEKNYENAMMIELKKAGLTGVKQKGITVFYDGEVIGEYFADVVVNETVILELKSAESLIPDHEYQLLNYLKATEIEVGLLFNFGKSPQIKRKVFSNSVKSLIPKTQS
jgi:GxxExxY protein